ncbi:hypothetical protein RFI_19071, partial [Reticulomyxa filosa]
VTKTMKVKILMCGATNSRTRQRQRQEQPKGPRAHPHDTKTFGQQSKPTQLLPRKPTDFEPVMLGMFGKPYQQAYMRDSLHGYRQWQQQQQQQQQQHNQMQRDKNDNDTNANNNNNGIAIKQSIHSTQLQLLKLNSNHSRELLRNSMSEHAAEEIDADMVHPVAPRGIAIDSFSPYLIATTNCRYLCVWQCNQLHWRLALPPLDIQSYGITKDRSRLRFCAGRLFLMDFVAYKIYRFQ